MVRLLPRSNATTRYGIWLVALALTVAAPFLLLIPRSGPAAISTATAPSAPLVVPVTVQWPLYAALAWAAVALVLLARVIWSLAYIQGLKRRATLLGERGDIRVMASAEVGAPLAAGFLGRAIIFPQAVLPELTHEEFEQVLCHEMAHLRRGDDWAQLAHAMVQALLFFNPAVYWIGRRLKIEREMACDDWVVATTGAARPYAACLTHLHEVTRRAPTPQLAAGAISRRKWQLSARVEALLEPGRNSTPRFSRPGWIAAGALISAGLIVAARTAPPVGVQEIPVATMAMAHLSAPLAPEIARVRRDPLRPRSAHLTAPRTMPQQADAVMAAAFIDAPVVVVREWQVNQAPQYFVITVVFFQPPRRRSY